MEDKIILTFPLLTAFFAPEKTAKTLVSNVRDYLAKSSKEDFVPEHIIANLEQAWLLGSKEAKHLLVEVVLTRNCILSKRTKTSYFKEIYQENSSAAYHLGLSATYDSRAVLKWASDKDDPPIWKYFYHAAKLGHSGAFHALLGALETKTITITSEEFIKMCKEFAASEANAQMQYDFILGILKCGFDLLKYPSLGNLVPFDAAEGYQLLQKVHVSSSCEIYSKEAARIIRDCRKREEFDEATAAKIQCNYLDGTPVTGDDSDKEEHTIMKFGA